MWKTAVALLADPGDDDQEENDRRIAFLSIVIRQHPDDVSRPAMLLGCVRILTFWTREK